MSDLTPRTNEQLFGHGDAEAGWLRQRETGKLAHGWIIAGPKGIGKATLAFRLTRQLLSGAHRIATGAHADLLVVEPEWNEKKDEPGTVITVEQAREVARFLSLTPADGEWRVVIIDSADALNNAAANAILKILEEPPPQTVLLLISHNPGRLLPTIRSRAAMLKLTPLASEDFNDVMRLLHPEMDYQRRAALYALSCGSPGMAAEMEEQGALDIYAAMLDIVSALPAPDAAKIHAFCDPLGGAQGHAPFQMFTRLALVLFERLGKTAAGLPLSTVVAEEKEILQKLAPLHTPGGWAVKWQQALEQLSLAEARHLDTRQVAIVFFHSIADNESMLLASA